jgi:uroporphyrinogen decarboxylase
MKQSPPTHRERVLRALNHQEPDRVPLAAYSMTDVCYTNLRAHLGLPSVELAYLGDVSDVVSPHEDLLRCLDLDTRDVALTTTTPRSSTWESDEVYENELGVGFRKHGVFYYYAVQHPLSGERTVADVERYPWPEPDRSPRTALRDKVRALRRETDCALVMGVGGTMFATAWFLCGDDWFIDLATNAPFCDALMEKLLELELARAEGILASVGSDGIDVAICTADDLGMQSGLLISPELYRRFVKPRQRCFFEYVKRHSSAKIFVHCDGAIYPLIPDFIEIGVEILNPVQVECRGMGDTRRLKREFGRDLAFWGGLDNQRVLSFGTPEEVRDEVRRRIDDLAPGGGYVLTPRWAVRPEVPPENLCAIYEAVEAYGRY